MAAIPASSPGRKLLKQVTCPHCWREFRPHEILFIAEHGELLGDTVLGDTAPRRFLPTRFTVEGQARDARNQPCSSMACPQCHLQIPPACLEMPPLFLSIFGAPGSGKSYILAAATWGLRTELPSRFGTGFRDADPGMNSSLIGYEERLFVNPNANTSVPLANLIDKTQEKHGDLNNFVLMGGRDVSLSRPFLFVLQPSPGTPNAIELNRLLCLYDNAGESFQPGRDTADNPVTRHMARSKALFFVFDPTQDARFRRAAGLQALASGEKLSRQEPYLHEAAKRIRKHSGIAETQQHDVPLIVVLTKFDLWCRIVGGPAALQDTPVLVEHRTDGAHVLGLRIRHIHEISARLRNVLKDFCPEVVHAAESFCKTVVFVPTSAVGPHVHIDPKTRGQAIRPAETAPQWATVPFLYGLARSTRGLVPIARE